MALNSSGPISLGGTTAGQSINLELGQAATALTSLNATNVRTLLAVPSGTISLSNAYGKSSNSYWIVYLGRARSNTQSSNTVFLNGTNTAHTAPNGITAVQMTVPGTGSGNNVRFTYISNDGTVASSSNFGNGNPAYSTPASTNSSSTVFPFTIGGSNAYQNLINSSYNLAYGNSGTVGPVFPYEVIRGTIASDNTVASVGLCNRGKSGYFVRWTKFGSGGGVTISRELTTRSFSNTTGGNGFCPGVYVRSDNSYLINWQDTGPGFADRNVFSVLNSSLGNSAQYYEVTTPNRAGGGGCINLADNTFWFLTNQQICRLDSGASSGQYWEFANRKAGGSNAPRAWGMAIYNNILYFGCSYDSGGSTNATPSFTIHAWNISTSSFSWSKNFQFNTVSQYMPFTEYQGGSIQANANGVFIKTVGIPGDSTNQAFLIKIPLTGPANATYASVAPGNSLTISDRTMTSGSATSMSVSQQNNLSFSDKGGSNTLVCSPVAPDTLSITKTAIT